MSLFLSFLIFLQYGYLTVLSEEGNLPVYLDGDYFGKTPIVKEKIKVGKYTISLFSKDSMELTYQKFKRGSIFQKLSSLWELAKYSKATEMIRIAQDSLTEIFLSKKGAEKAKRKAKIYFFSSLSSIFLLGVLTGILLE
ncbi:MAG: PEGA domain-containing protein [candidate division WOR-3 bacterium]|nr:PEGA domain-containing protein [candidate division WOR-3 bacterium]MCX7837684.1 PEGA domain-containing protein [candidate division WOR-3 bacterium]MDW8113415.1 PEGA domain-containing protein [candidate division WOR-3 bacterium]